MGFALAALAVLATFLAIWVAASLGDTLRADAPKASVSPAGLGISVVDEG